MSQEKVTIIEGVLFSSFASLGGLLAYMMRSLNKEEPPKLKRAIVEMLSSAFVGFLAMLACKALNVDYYWSGIIVGVFGWMGAEASIVLLASMVRKRLGIGSDGTNKNP